MRCACENADRSRGNSGRSDHRTARRTVFPVAPPRRIVRAGYNGLRVSDRTLMPGNSLMTNPQQATGYLISNTHPCRFATSLFSHAKMGGKCLLFHSLQNSVDNGGNESISFPKDRIQILHIIRVNVRSSVFNFPCARSKYFAFQAKSFSA